MRIKKIELIHIKLPLIEPFKISSGVLTERESIIIKMHSMGVIGYGESAPMAAPFYSYETIHTAMRIIEEHIVPMLKDVELKTPEDLNKVLSSIRGNPFAKAGIETAFWDVMARKDNVSLKHIIGSIADRIPSGVAIGIPADLQELIDKVYQFENEGYKRIKIKIQPGWDVLPVRTIREKFPNIPLMVDANSAYNFEEHLDIFRELDQFDLLMIEQPLHWNDLVDHAKLQKKLRTPVCLDESIHSVDDARKAWELKSCRIINIKIQRVGGLYNAKLIHDYCASRDIPVWCGTMPETGIGQSQGLALAGLPDFRYPADLEPSLRFFVDDIVDPLLELNDDGTISVPKSYGVAKIDEKKIKKYTYFKNEWTL